MLLCQCNKKRIATNGYSFESAFMRDPTSNMVHKTLSLAQVLCSKWHANRSNLMEHRFTHIKGKIKKSMPHIKESTG